MRVASLAFLRARDSNLAVAGAHAGGGAGVGGCSDEEAGATPTSARGRGIGTAPTAAVVAATPAATPNVAGATRAARGEDTRRAGLTTRPCPTSAARRLRAPTSTTRQRVEPRGACLPGGTTAPATHAPQAAPTAATAATRDDDAIGECVTALPHIGCAPAAPTAGAACDG